MTILWTFLNESKLELFAAILRANDIAYETGTRSGAKGELSISVDEKDQAQAKRLLMRHRKRRTPSEYR